MYHICDLVLMGRGPPGGLQDQVGHPTTITGELGAILFTIAIAATTTAIDSFIAHDRSCNILAIVTAMIACTATTTPPGPHQPPAIVATATAMIIIPTSTTHHDNSSSSTAIG